MSATAPPAPNLAERLRNVRVGIRGDLEVSRHLFRNEPAYIIRDPISFQSHRFAVSDYAILVRISTDITLGELFESLVREGQLQNTDEEHYYSFVFQLHRLGLLALPVSDAALLYKRYQARQAAKAKSRWKSILFFQLPLWNPNRFLDLTVQLARPLFTRTAFVIWCLVVLSALYVAAARWDDLFQPLEALLATRNLVIMWITLVTLKFFHEFGHAFACKRFGGVVPEIGAMFIVGTPIAYVDATASWGFSRRIERMIVGLAGMYFESFFASIAVFVWAASEPGLIKAIAYNTMLLASVVTILFNINPLMRFDGYYLFSDLVEIPNLRSRSMQAVRDFLKRKLLGVATDEPPRAFGFKLTLLGYGFAAMIYKTTLTLGIATLIAFKLLLPGLVLAGLYVGSAAWGVVKQLYGYLLFAEETRPVRGRAVALGVGLAGLLIAGIGWMPVRQYISAAGTVHSENEMVVRVTTPGVLVAAPRETGDLLNLGTPLARLANIDVDADIAAARSALEATHLRREALMVTNVAMASIEAQRSVPLREELRRREEQAEELVITSPIEGRVMDSVDENDLGRYLQTGDEIAILGSGIPEVRVLIDEQSLSLSYISIGAEVEFRSKSDPGQTLIGTITHISPAGAHELGQAALTHAGGGDIVVDAHGRAERAYFLITIALPDGAEELGLGATGVARFKARRESFGLFVLRRLARFVQTLEMY